jgi:hypothetical protein
MQSDWASKIRKQAGLEAAYKKLEDNGIFQDKKSTLDTSFIDKNGKQIYHPNSNVEQTRTPDQEKLIDELSNLKAAELDLGGLLQQKYGNGNINLSTGEITSR